MAHRDQFNKKLEEYDFKKFLEASRKHLLTLESAIENGSDNHTAQKEEGERE